MQNRTLVSLSLALAVGLANLAGTSIALADSFEPWDMMDPDWWFGDDDDDWEYWAYGPGRYGYGGPYGWAGPHGWPGPHAWGAYPGYRGQRYIAGRADEEAPPPPKLPE